VTGRQSANPAAGSGGVPPTADDADRPEGCRSPHGTRARYDRWKCRCDACRAAKMDAQRDQRRDHRARRDTAQFKHGASAYDSWGCRCDICRTAHAADMARRRRDMRARRDTAQFKHGAAGYDHWGCRCETCTAAVAGRDLRHYYRRYRESPKGRATQRRYRKTPKSLATQRVVRARRQARTLEGARRYRYAWTGPELEIAARDDLTIKQIALMLGRTYNAVRWARQCLERDPRKQFLAGQRGLLP